ncbi:MAG TPA: hypothetical protein VFA38_08760 [Nitrospirales bacterium]|nr:hypothetical protein [Nitrospirales bacterium]
MKGIAAMLASLVLAVTIGGCASEPPQSPSNKEVRTNADRSFDRMKQDERERTKGAQGGY